MTSSVEIFYQATLYTGFLKQQNMRRSRQITWSTRSRVSSSELALLTRKKGFILVQAPPVEVIALRPLG
jgi:hypothetical protein